MSAKKSSAAKKKSLKALVDEGIKVIAPDVKPVSAKAIAPLLDAILDVSEMATAQTAETITAQLVETLSDNKLIATIEAVAAHLALTIAEQFAASLMEQLAEQFSDDNPMDQIADKVAEKIADQIAAKFTERTAVIQLQ